MSARILKFLVLASSALVSACANLTSIPPGTPAASVEASRGKPFRVWPETGGGSSWEYPTGPQGRYTYMIRVGADGRVARVDQVLGWDTFRNVSIGMPAQEVEHMLGRPYSKVTFPLTGQTAWAWRFVDTTLRQCFYAYVGTDGKVAGTGARDEDPNTMGNFLSVPC